jgi:hypothetical protein
MERGYPIERVMLIAEKNPNAFYHLEDDALESNLLADLGSAEGAKASAVASGYVAQHTKRAASLKAGGLL